MTSGPAIGLMTEDMREWFRLFWSQPNKAYRNFQAAFFLLGVHFLIPSMVYAFNPQGAIDAFRWLGGLYGKEYPFAEDGFVWRVLAAGNVCTLAFMCFLIQANVKRFYPVLWPLCFLKGFAALGFLTAYFYGGHFPPFFLVFVWDSTNVLMFLYFAHTAYWGLKEWGEEVAVPGLKLRER
jgi:hypothetical protein